MSKCPKCGYWGQDHEFSEHPHVWQIDSETKMRIRKYKEDQLLELMKEFADGKHAGTDIIMARESDFDSTGRLTRGYFNGLIITSSHSGSKMSAASNNMLEWFGTYTEMRRRWK